MMKEIETNIVILKDRVEEIKDIIEKAKTSRVYIGEYHRIQDAILEGLVETLELFYKLVTQ